MRTSVSNSRRSCKYRRGMTLVEMTLVITLSATLSGIAVAVMAAVLRANDATQQHTAERNELQRLAATLRADIHRATECQWDAKGQSLSLNLLERQSIVYQLLENRWVRIASREDGTPVTSAFGLSGQFGCRCRPRQAQQGELVSTQFGNDENRTAGEDGAQLYLRPRLRCEVVATVGRDHELFHE